MAVLSKSMWLGQKLGISKDRVGNSFIKAHNLIVKSHVRRLTRHAPDPPPQMPGKGGKAAGSREGQWKSCPDRHRCRRRGGQNRDRRSIAFSHPCRRVREGPSISGIRDVAEKIPVLAVPNKRPEGPCKNTRVHLDDVDDALTFVAGMAEKAGGSQERP